MKMNILEEILAQKRKEIAEEQQYWSMESERKSAMEKHWATSMRRALEASPHGIIAEYKRKSPSRGWIARDSDACEVITGYQKAGAAAISVLTDEKFFGGYQDYIFSLVRDEQLVHIPVLRKDFIIDEYQIARSRAIGASTILLIAAALTPGQCAELAALAHDPYGLEVLLEVHNEEELAWLTPDVDMLGINNRDLTTFRTDVETSFRLAEKVHATMASTGLSPLLVSESGISDPGTILRLRDAGFRGFLIGEAFMTSEDPVQALRDFIAAL